MPEALEVLAEDRLMDDRHPDEEEEQRRYQAGNKPAVESVRPTYHGRQTSRPKGHRLGETKPLSHDDPRAT